MPPPKRRPRRSRRAFDPRRGDFQGVALLRQPGIEFERKIGVPGVLSRRDVFLPEQLCEVVGRRAEQRVGRGDADAAAEVERSLSRFYAKGRRDDFGGGESFRQAAKSRQQTGSRYAKCFMTLFECYGCLQADILRRRADGDDEVALFHHAAALRVDKRQRFVSERKAYLPLFARCEPDAPEAAELSGRAYR